MDSGSQHLASNMTPRRYNFNSRPRDVNPNKNYKQLNSQPHKSTPLNRNQNMLFYPFVFLPERMRTACDRSGANGKSPRKGKRIPLNEINYNEQRDEETGYGYFPHQARQTSTGHIPLLCPYQRPTISLPTPPTVGDGWAFAGPKITFIRAQTY